MTDFTPRTPAVFVGVGLSGVTHYRTMLPARAIGASMLFRTADLAKMKLVGDAEAPVAVYSMPRSPEMMDECVQILANPDRALAIDLDDCLRDTVEDGIHPAAEDWAPLLDKHEWLLSRADLVTVTTPYLADYAASCGAQRTQIIPNALDIERWNQRREPRHREFTIIGWSGSIGHEKALARVAPALESLLRRRDDIAFSSVGPPLSAYFPADLRHRFHDVPFQPLARHPMVLTQFHINIGPGLRTNQYRAKSDLRLLEAMASDTTFIGHPYPYGETMNEADYGWAADDPALLVECIEEAMLHHKASRDERVRGGKWVRANRLIEHTAPLWREAVMSVLP